MVLDAMLLRGEEIVAEYSNDTIRFVSVNIGEKFIDFYMTNFRLICVFRGERRVVWFPLSSIASIDKVGSLGSQQPTRNIGKIYRKETPLYGFKIVMKEVGVFFLALKPDRMYRRNLHAFLLRVAFPLSQTNSIHQLFASAYALKSETLHDFSSSIILENEYLRMGIGTMTTWTFTNLNQTYQLCPSYPSLLVVPKNLSETDIIKCSKFRTKCRLPVLSWIHPVTGASLTRSSQPKPGLFRKRSKEDEKYLRCIWSTTSPQEKLHVIDARPLPNAVMNQFKGAGYENASSYDFIKMHFVKIANIHVMRGSYEALTSVCLSEPFQTTNDFLLTLQRRIESTKWIKHIRKILKGALKVATLLNRGAHVLVHCSDGWDRTPTLTSLAQILLDPYFRTITGFQRLIDREWCAFGHKFQDRCGHGMNLGIDSSARSETSPVMIQFMDAVYQIIRQFPDAFQFRSSLLVHILGEMYACRYGNFLRNTEQERKSLPFPVHSIWSEFDVELFKNASYKEDCSIELSELSLDRLSFWAEYYCFHDRFQQSQ